MTDFLERRSSSTVPKTSYQPGLNPVDLSEVLDGSGLALSAIVGRKVGIRPKRHDDWLVVPNLWGAVIGRPGYLHGGAIAGLLALVVLAGALELALHERVDSVTERALKYDIRLEDQGDDLADRFFAGRQLADLLDADTTHCFDPAP